jgi:hypothetical protein
MSLANPRWGAPRIHGELLKLGIQVSRATVAKYMVRHRKPPTWPFQRIFLLGERTQLEENAVVTGIKKGDHGFRFEQSHVHRCDQLLAINPRTTR